MARLGSTILALLASLELDCEHEYVIVAKRACETPHLPGYSVKSACRTKLLPDVDGAFYAWKPRKYHRLFLDQF